MGNIKTNLSVGFIFWTRILQSLWKLSSPTENLAVMTHDTLLFPRKGFAKSDISTWNEGEDIWLLSLLLSHWWYLSALKQFMLTGAEVLTKHYSQWWLWNCRSTGLLWHPWFNQSWRKGVKAAWKKFGETNKQKCKLLHECCQKLDFKSSESEVRERGEIVYDIPKRNETDELTKQKETQRLENKLMATFRGGEG